jgi:hypothetical protein
VSHHELGDVPSFVTKSLALGIIFLRMNFLEGLLKNRPQFYLEGVVGI